MNQYFAQLLNNQVQQVIVADQEFIDSGAVGDPSQWISAVRKRMAAAGDTYDPTIDAFVPPQPFPSWILDTETAQWQPPVARPESGWWRWDEAGQVWQEVTLPV